MTIYDAAMVILVVLGMIRGAWRGFTWQAASIASLLLGYTSARTISSQIAPHMPGEPEVQRILAMAVVYVAVSGGIFALAWMVRGTIRKFKFDAYDRHLGMLLGGAEGVGVGLLGTLLVVSLAPNARQPIFSSPTGHIVGSVMNQIGPVLPAEVRRVLAPHWDGIETAESVAEAAPSALTSSSTAILPPDTSAASVPAPLPAVPPATASRVAATPANQGKEKARGSQDPAIRRTAEVPAAPQLDGLLEKGRREIEQAVAETFDADPDQKATSLRQLVDKNKQRVKDVVNGTLGQTQQKIGSHVQDRVNRTQQGLEKAISDSVARGQQKVEKAITNSIDQQLRRLGGLEASPAPQKGKQ